jgi:hypothetical protein
VPGNYDALFTSGTLIDLSISYWRGRKALQPRDLGLRPEDVPAIYSLGKKLLLPKAVIVAFRSIEEKAAYLIESASFSFPIARLRFLPRAKVAEVVAGLEAYRTEFLEQKRHLIREYDNLREQMLRDHPKYRNALEGYYPSRRALERCFDFHWDLFALALPRDLPVVRVTAEKVSREERARQVAAQRYQERIKQQVDGFLDDVVQTLRSKTVDLCRHVATKIEKGELITEATINSVKDWITRFESLNFINDQPVAKQLASLRKTLGTRTAKEYREDEDAASVLGKALTGIVENVSRIADISAITGTYKRRICLD